MCSNQLRIPNNRKYFSFFIYHVPLYFKININIIFMILNCFQAPLSPTTIKSINLC